MQGYGAEAECPKELARSGEQDAPVRPTGSAYGKFLMDQILVIDEILDRGRDLLHTLEI